MKCIFCLNKAKFVQKGTQLTFCGKKCQFDYISGGQKRKIDFDPEYITIIANNADEFKIKRKLIGIVAELEDFSCLATKFYSEDLYLVFHATYSVLFDNRVKLVKLMEIADFLGFENDMLLDMYLLVYADYDLLYKNREKLGMLKYIANSLNYENIKLQNMENYLNNDNLLEYVEIVSLEHTIYIEKAAFIAFTDFEDMQNFDNEISYRFNVFNVSKNTLEIFESLTRKNLSDFNLNLKTLQELAYISIRLEFVKFYKQLTGSDYIENLEELNMDQKIELLQKKPKNIIIYNSILRFIVEFWIERFFIEDQNFLPKDIAEGLEYREGDEFEEFEYNLKPSTILMLPDNIIIDLLLYLKLEQVPNYEYFVMGFRSSHPRLWKVVSLFMKKYM